MNTAIKRSTCVPRIHYALLGNSKRLKRNQANLPVNTHQVEVAKDLWLHPSRKSIRFAKFVAKNHMWWRELWLRNPGGVKIALDAKCATKSLGKLTLCLNFGKRCYKNISFSLDTYMSHEGVLYCKPHHKELFLPKTVKNDIIDVNNVTETQEAVLRHQEQQRKMETIIRENEPVDLGDQVVKCSTYDKFSGLENLDVGSKYKMFEAAASDEPEERGPSSDRYGIMEKLKRLQEGGDVEDLLAELDEELPSDEEEEEDEEDAYLTEVQKKVSILELKLTIS